LEQTAFHDNANGYVLAQMPAGLSRVVDVGCMSGALGREYRKANPGCDYIGVELDPKYAEVARGRLSSVVTGAVDALPDAEFERLFPSDCWIFSDVLEHINDPWALLGRLYARLAPGAIVIASIPNVAHWSVQARIATGHFDYEDSGLLDRTHIRWFTRRTIIQMFERAGFGIVQGSLVVAGDPPAPVLAAVRALAAAVGGDADEADADCRVFQYVVKAERR
jgi:SAM-dependent methyltransferase